MNILVVSLGFPDFKNNSNASKFVLNECLAYAMNGAKVKVITPHRHNALRYEKLHENIEVHRYTYFLPTRLQAMRRVNVPMYKNKGLIHLIQWPFFLGICSLAILKHCRWADIIHCQWTLTTMLALPSKLFSSAKIVTTYRGGDMKYLPSKLNGIALRKSDAVINCWYEQQWNLDIIEKYQANYIKLPLIVRDREVLPVPHDISEDVKSGKFIIGYIGRLQENIMKNIGLPTRILIDAVDILIKEGYDNISLVYIGEGQEVKEEMMQKVERLGLTSSIRFLGLKERVEEYIQYFNLGAGGSSFSSVSQEHSFNKVPQILIRGFDNVNVPWEHKKNALFIDHNSVEDLVEVIKYAIEDAERLKEIGEKAEMVIQDYVQDMTNGGKIYLEAFSKLK